MTKDISEKTNDQIPTVEEWTFDTIFNAPLNGNLLAGNVNFTADQTKCIRIKRAEKDSYTWITLFEIPIKTNEDLAFSRIDRIARGNMDYKYALIPVWNDDIEGNYNVNTVKSEFHGLWLAEKDISLNALLNLEMSTKQNILTSTIVCPSKTHPYVNRYGNVNYTTGEFTATFINLNREERQFDLQNAVKYREMVDDFLLNGNPKVIKHFDGRIWLAAIDDSIEKDESEYYEMPVYSVTFTSVGDPSKSGDLYDSNIIDYDVERGNE